MNAIVTQLRDPINSGLTRWRMAVQVNKWTLPRKSGGIPHQIQPKYGDEQTDAGRDCRTVSRDQFFRRERGQGNIHFPVQLTTSRISDLARMIFLFLYVMTDIHTYIHYSVGCAEKKFLFL